MTTSISLRAVLKTGAAASLLALTGCAALIPNTVTPEFTHESHLTQHEPFSGHPTNYGANIADLALGWRLPHHVSVSLAEGFDLDRHYRSTNSCGEVMGPREQFIGRVAYTFDVH